MEYRVAKKVLVSAALVLALQVPNCWAQKDKKTFVEVATNDCGVTALQPFLVKGDSYTLPSEFKGSQEALTCNFGGTVIYAFDKIDIQADYQMEVVFLADEDRKIQISADGNPVCEPIVVPANKEIHKKINLPRKTFAYGQLVLIFEALEGANAIVSGLHIYSTNPSKLVAFTGNRKEELKNSQSYKINTDVNVEKVLPVYAPFPNHTKGVYQPIISLNGVWQFTPKEGEKWQTIQVPGQWSMQGFKVDSASWAAYRTTFSLPADWKGKQVKLRFDGVHSEYTIHINGTQVGSHLGGMTAYELNITPYLTADNNNELIVKVRSESLADMLGSLTQYAAHQLGGITRKVTLFAIPDTHVSGLRILTDLDDQYKDATLKVYASVTNNSSKQQNDSYIRVSLLNHSASKEVKIPALSAGETWSGWVEMPVASPLLWDNEHPNLYTMNVELRSGDVILEQLSKRIGFREIQLDGNKLLVNGKEVKLRGVCRHEAHPLTGRVLTTEQRWLDAKLYMEGNCNFIRTSHYPPAEEFIDACDELGLFVEVESPVCWVGHGANENWKKLNYRDPSYYNYVLQANMESIQFNRNHPSILFWSMANESYWNKEFAQVSEYMKKADPTRPYTFHDQAYGGFNNQGSTAPIANIHYPGPNGYKVAAKSNRPMIYGEFCHLNVYNRSELVTDPGVRSDWALALSPTWDKMYETQGVLGGSIWSGIDDVFQLPDGNAVGYGAWGPIDGWRRPKPEYWDMKKIYSPIRVLTQNLQPNTSLDIELENRYTFTNFNELQISYTYGTEKGIINAEIAPGQKGKVTIPISNPDKANQLSLTFVDRKGFVADEYIIPVGQQIQNNWPEVQSEPTKLKEKSGSFLIVGKQFSCEVSKASGQIVFMKRDNEETIIGGPWLMALPLTGGGCYPNHNANTPAFNDLCSDWKVENVKAAKNGENVVINVEGSYKEFKGNYSLTINAGGELSVNYSFNALQDVNPRQWGLVFDLPKSYNKTFWRRDGMWSVYPNDHISRSVGEAELYYPGLPQKVDPRTEPIWAWSRDFNELGSNDFRSTRRNIWYAGLVTPQGDRVTVLSNGKQHWRSWFTGEKIHFLIADFVTPGDEMFLSSYYDSYRKPLKKGDNIQGTIKLQVESNGKGNK